MSKYLKFIADPKINDILVKSKLHGDKLGSIRWFGKWRQYAFFPEKVTIFNIECLSDIITYIKGL